VPTAMDGYRGTPLPKKLGIGPGSSVSAINPPSDLVHILGPLPADVRWLEGEEASIVLLFLRSGTELEQGLRAALHVMSKGGRLWMLWPKKASGVPSDLTQNSVRAFGLAAGLVDYKVASIDATWSGLCFARRGSKSSH